jgi:hypothetical protein
MATALVASLLLPDEGLVAADDDKTPRTYRGGNEEEGTPRNSETEMLNTPRVGVEVFPGLHVGTPAMRGEIRAHIQRAIQAHIREHLLCNGRDEDSDERIRLPRNPWIILAIVTKEERALCTPMPANTREHVYEYLYAKSLQGERELFDMGIQLYRYAQKTNRRLAVQCQNTREHAAAVVLAILLAATGLPMMDVLSLMWETMPEMIVGSDMRDFLAATYSPKDRALLDAL